MNKRSESKPLAIALMGPTASGKTALAIRLAQHLDGEIISVDSALVYKGLDIGAAKPSREELALVPHALIDIRDPSEPYSAAEFSKDATLAIQDIVKRGKTPILAGGTMLYFKALLEGLSPMPPSDPAVRLLIDQEAAEKGWGAMHAELQKVDPDAAARIHPNHSQRLSRALEVWRVSGKPMSEWQSGFSGGLLDHYDWRQIALAPRDRSILHQRIEQRFKAMLDDGFIAEVERLRARGDLHKDLPAIRAVGYRQAWEYLDGDYDYGTLCSKGVIATRQLAKRQLTWLRGWHSINWLDTQGLNANMKDIKEILQECLNICDKGAI